MPRQRKHPRPPVGREARGRHSRAQRQRNATERPHIWRLEMRFHAPRALQAQRPGAWEHSPQMHQAPSCRAPKQHRETRQRRRPRSVATGSPHPCTEATGPRAGAPWPAYCSRPLPTLHPRGPGRRATISTGGAVDAASARAGPSLVCLHGGGGADAASTGARTLRDCLHGGTAAGRPNQSGGRPWYADVSRTSTGAATHGAAAGAPSLGGDGLAAPARSGDGCSVGSSTPRIPSAGGRPLCGCPHGGTTTGGRLNKGGTARAAFEGVRPP